MTKTKAPAYIVLLSAGDELKTYIYRNPAEARTYYVGHLDPRAGDEDSYVRFDRESVEDVLGWLQENQGTKCLVEVSLAQRVYNFAGIKDMIFADPV